MIGAAVCAAAAIMLAMRPRARADGCVRSSPSWPIVGWPLVLLSTAALTTLVPGQWVALATVVAIAAAGANRLRGRQSRRLAAAHESARVLEACEQLAAELTAGQPPGTALQRIASDWSPLAPAAEAFALGADVPAALRKVAARPGAGELRLLAAGWQVSHRTGAGLAGAVQGIADSLREQQATRRLVSAELASARATARLVAGLPVLALVMGSGAGGAPWGFLLATPAGLVCLGSGLAFGLVGLWWIEALTGEAR